MKIMKIIFVLVVFLGCDFKVTNPNPVDQTIAPNVLNNNNSSTANYNSPGYNCSDPASNLGYQKDTSDFFTIYYRTVEDIIIVDIVNAYKMQINTSGIFNELRDSTKVLEIVFCDGDYYLKTHSKPQGFNGSKICILDGDNPYIKFTQAEITVGPDPVIAPDRVCIHPFNNGNDKNYFVFIEESPGPVQNLYFAFSLDS